MMEHTERAENKGEQSALFEKIHTYCINFLMMISVVYSFFFLLVFVNTLFVASSAPQGMSSIANPSVVDSGLGFTRQWIVNLLSGTLVIVVVAFLRKKKIHAAWISYFPSLFISLWPAYALYTNYSMPFSEIPSVNYFPVLLAIVLYAIVLVLLVIDTLRQGRKSNQA